jgi:actin-related protein
MLEEDGHGPTTVMELGSGNTRAGFAGEDRPRAELSSFVVHPPRIPTCMLGLNIDTTHHVGDREKAQKFPARTKYAVQRGAVTDYDAVERIWMHMFYNELKVAPEECPVLIADSATAHGYRYRCRESLSQIMFETFAVPALYIAGQPALSLYASGRTTGLVVESGYGVTNTVPIHEGYEVPLVSHTLELAGNDITQHLKMQLTVENKLSDDQFDLIKERYCYISEAFDNEAEKVQEVLYELPDGQTIKLEAERYECPEILFQPQLVTPNSDGIHQLAYRSINKCDIGLQATLYSNILLAGGSTMFTGMETRLSKEISKCSSRTDVNVIAPENRKQSCWFGGSIFASRLANEEWISKGDYDEHGPSLVRRCR